MESCEKCKNAESKCLLCKRTFCLDHTSKQNVLLCSECFSGVEVNVKFLEKTTNYFSTKQNKMITQTQKYKLIKFNGEPWLKLQNLIPTLSIEELEQAIELERATVQLMEQELTSKIINKKKSDNIKLNTPTTVKVVQQHQQKEKKKNSSVNTLAAQLTKSGITKEMLQKMLIKKYQEKTKETIKVETTTNTSIEQTQELDKLLSQKPED